VGRLHSAGIFVFSEGPNLGSSWSGYHIIAAAGRGSGSARQSATSSASRARAEGSPWQPGHRRRSHEPIWYSLVAGQEPHNAQPAWCSIHRVTVAVIFDSEGPGRGRTGRGVRLGMIGRVRLVGRLRGSRGGGAIHSRKIGGSARNHQNAI
jgi:hypothetical protein